MCVCLVAIVLAENRSVQQEKRQRGYGKRIGAKIHHQAAASAAAAATETTTTTTTSTVVAEQEDTHTRILYKGVEKSHAYISRVCVFDRVRVC